MHTQAAPRAAGAAWSCTPPTPGDLPPISTAAADTRWGFFPLCWDRPDAPPAARVRVFCAAAAEGVHGHDGRWGVAVAAAGAVDPPLRLLARSRADAESWAAQLRARAAPLAAVWARHGGGACRRPGGGATDGVNAATSGPDDAVVAAALQDGARRVLTTDVVMGVAGVVTALVKPNAYNVAVAAGPVAGVALGALAFAARVLFAARCVFEAAVGVAVDLDDLDGKLVEHVLPSAGISGRRRGWRGGPPEQAGAPRRRHGDARGGAAPPGALPSAPRRAGHPVCPPARGRGRRPAGAAADDRAQRGRARAADSAGVPTPQRRGCGADAAHGGGGLSPGLSDAGGTQRPPAATAQHFQRLDRRGAAGSAAVHGGDPVRLEDLRGGRGTRAGRGGQNALLPARRAPRCGGHRRAAAVSTRRALGTVVAGLCLLPT